MLKSIIVDILINMINTLYIMGITNNITFCTYNIRGFNSTKGNYINHVLIIVTAIHQTNLILSYIILLCQSRYFVILLIIMVYVMKLRINQIMHQ